MSFKCPLHFRHVSKQAFKGPEFFKLRISKERKNNNNLQLIFSFYYQHIILQQNQKECSFKSFHRFAEI